MKTKKTKFRERSEDRDEFVNVNSKKKQRDKTLYRLLRNEEKDYVL